MKTAKMGRREAIAAMGAAGAALAFGCSSNSATDPGATSVIGTNSACAITPTETAGPFPSLVDLFRSDIREGKPGTLLTLTVKVVNVNNNCAGVANANVEIWHVDAAGNYSQYGTQSGQTYLRGIQTTNSSGEVTFTTIYPGWYSGRATHIHLEVTINGASVKVSQIAFPCRGCVVGHCFSLAKTHWSHKTSQRNLMIHREVLDHCVGTLPAETEVLCFAAG